MGRRVAGNVPLIVAASAGLVLLVAGTLGWLGWRLLSQEETLLRQRSQDRLEQAADALLAGFLRTVADTESWLGQISSAFPADADGPARRGGMLVMFSGRGVHTQPSGVLPYLPVSPPSVAVDSAVFQPSELLEFQLRDLSGAATLLTQLASRGNTLVRAEALLRLARVQAKAGHIEQALATYRRLRDETLIGPAEAPYSLLSRFARVQLLADSNREAAARTEARELLTDLQSGRFAVGKETFAWYESGARKLSGEPASAAPTPRTGCCRRRRSDLERVADLPAQWLTDDEQAPACVHAGRGRRGAECEPGSPRRADPCRRIDPQLRSGPWCERRRAAVSSHVARRAWRTDQRCGASVLIAAGDAHPVRGRTPLESVARIIERGVGRGPARRATDVFRRRPRRCRAAGLRGLLRHRARRPSGSGRRAPAIRLRLRRVTRIPDSVDHPAPTHRIAGARTRPGRKPAAAVLRRAPEGDVETASAGGGSARLRTHGRRPSSVPVSSLSISRRWYAKASRSTGASRAATDTASSSTSNPAPLVVDADREALRRVIRNLLENAVKYSPDSPTVWVETEHEPNAAVLRVRDQGIGIPPEEHARIFDKFVRGEGGEASVHPGHGHRPGDGQGDRRGASRRRPAVERRGTGQHIPGAAAAQQVRLGSVV